MKTLRDYMDIVDESFNTMLDLEPNASIEELVRRMAGNNGITNIKAFSADSPETHYITFDFDGAREVHILGKGMTPFFTKDNPAPMRVFSTAINLVKQHAEDGGLVRLECNPDEESIEFYRTFANRAKRMGFDVEFIPRYKGSSNVMVAAFEISKPSKDI